MQRSPRAKLSVGVIAVVILVSAYPSPGFTSTCATDSWGEEPGDKPPLVELQQPDGTWTILPESDPLLQDGETFRAWLVAYLPDGVPKPSYRLNTESPGSYGGLGTFAASCPIRAEP